MKRERDCSLAIDYDTFQREAAQRLPMLIATDAERALVRRRGATVSAAHFMAQVQALAQALPAATAAVNLCEDRYAFLVAFCALVLRGQINLLPSSRALRAIDEVMSANPGCYAIGEQILDPKPPGYWRMPSLDEVLPSPDSSLSPWVAAEQVVAIGYTSGSTGTPSANVKTWGSFHASNAGNLQMLQRMVGAQFEIVATVPPQHMYGLEMSVLLPLLAEVSVWAGRPFFPADVADALATKDRQAIAVPKVLVTTPVHLRALVESGIALPPIAAILSATAPMPIELARAAEQRFATSVLEVFGSTETCVFASRRSTIDQDWSLYDGVTLHPQPDGTVVSAPQLSGSVTLADIVTLSDAGRHFRLCGRHADMLEIAGKRASLSDLTRRLLAIPGVQDGVVLQLGDGDALGVHRIAALAVAPGLDEQAIFDALRLAIDPLFLPRPLRLVAALPRNETGKLPRAALIELLNQHA
jgi:acyl-coenzyme A synthetase/AMP-(fatty) acid ligase